jgi:hypothetical protein
VLPVQVQRGFGKTAFQDTVLQMLQRDPSQRPDMSQVVQRFNSVFQMDTITPAAAAGTSHGDERANINKISIQK